MTQSDAELPGHSAERRHRPLHLFGNLGDRRSIFRMRLKRLNVIFGPRLTRRPRLLLCHSRFAPFA